VTSIRKEKKMKMRENSLNISEVHLVKEPTGSDSNMKSGKICCR
jgi:hypothetical protein